MLILVGFFIALVWKCALATTCSDKVPLHENINGKITIKPGTTILTGTNHTITCLGTKSKPLLGKLLHNPLQRRITIIDIFGKSEEIIHSCRHHRGLRRCSLEQAGINVPGVNTFTCRFRTESDRFSCFISKNLTITDRACLISPPVCHANATCMDFTNMYKCSCKEGFSGNGTYCEDDYCPSLKCDKNATCVESGCKCNDGFFGNGTYCEETKIFGNKERLVISEKYIIITVGGVVFVVIVISLLLYYVTRKNSRGVSFTTADKVNERPGTAVDNFTILFPVENNGDFALRRLPSIADHNSKDENRDEDMNDLLTYICVVDDWEIEQKNLTILEQKLGGGQFGVVKKGLYREKINDDITVAVKMLKDTACASDRSDLLMELHVLKEVNKEPHPNVIKLIGAHTSEDVLLVNEEGHHEEEPLLVVTEYCSRGNLRNVLRNSRIKHDQDHSSQTYVNVFSKLSQRILLNIAIEIANGMKHLAVHQFVHRDLSARNVLIGADYEAKVSDFGLARPITGIDQMYVKSNRNLLPVKWMALESLTHGIFRTSSDIWAFGVLLWEITTLGDEPYPGISPYDILNYLACGKRMSRPPQCSEELYELMSKCWEATQEHRPDFPAIYQQLKNMFDDKQQTPYINIVEVADDNCEKLGEERERLQSLSELERYTKG